MIDAMHWLVQSARPHDSLFFHCSFNFISVALVLIPHQTLVMVGRQKTSTVMRSMAWTKSYFLWTFSGKVRS
jgi:hypothetical protein